MTKILLCGTLVASILLSSCKENEQVNTMANTVKETEKSTQTDNSQFNLAMQNVDTGGSFLMYEEQDNAMYEGIRDFILSTDDFKQDPSKQTIVNTIYKALDDYGMFDSKAYALSNKKQDNGYAVKFYMMTKDGYETKPAAQLAGGANAKLESLKYIDSNSDLVVAGRFNPGVLYDFILKTSQSIPEAGEFTQQVQSIPAMLNMMEIDFEKLKLALDTEMALAISFEEGKKIALPGLEAPSIKIKLLIGNKSGYLVELLNKMVLKKGLEAKKITSSENNGWTTYTSVDKLPIDKNPILAINDQWVMLSSDSDWLIPKTNFNQKAADMSSTKLVESSYSGNSFGFLNTKGALNWAEKLIPNIPDQDAQKSISMIVSKMQEKQLSDFWFASTIKPGAVSLNGQSAFAVSPTQLQAAYVGVVAAMVLPALGKARAKAVQKKDINNLKQMGLSIMMYYSDGTETLVPKDIKKFDFNLYNFKSDKYPNPTWESIAANKTDYLIHFKAGDALQDFEYSDVALITTRPGMQKDGSILVLFGDGHVERVPNIRTQEQLNEWLKAHSIKTDN